MNDSFVSMANLPVWAPGEEFVNTVTHAIGAVLSTIASVFIVRRGIRSQSLTRLIADIIFCLPTIELYAVSTFYHGTTNLDLKRTLRYIDHCSVFTLISGVYTAYGLTVLKGYWGYQWFVLMWVIALLGSIGKIFFFDLVEPFTAPVYVLQGWLCVVSVRTMMKVLTKRAIFWLFAGGIFYTIGAAVYTIDKPFIHAVFHVVMMFGTASHVVSYHCYT
jgi:hemolysin III